jgi:protein-S-isoprenylcysteine O-methyltransferase Ste14
VDSSRGELRRWLGALDFEADRPWLPASLLIAGFEVSFVVLASGQAYLEYRFGLSPVAVLVGVWVVWTLWHSLFFPRRRERYLAYAQRPYRSAFVGDIYPWVTLGFAQMWRPLFNGDELARILAGGPLLHATPAALTAGLTLCIFALLIMVRAIRTIGIARAAFLAEFEATEDFVPVESVIYRAFKHPLFWSGILFSFGLALIASTSLAFTLAAINGCYGLLYGRLEDRRLAQVFGDTYTTYAERVPGVPGYRVLSKAWRPLAAAAAFRRGGRKRAPGRR